MGTTLSIIPRIERRGCYSKGYDKAMCTVSGLLSGVQSCAQWLFATFAIVWSVLQWTSGLLAASLRSSSRDRFCSQERTVSLVYLLSALSSHLSAEPATCLFCNFIYLQVLRSDFLSVSFVSNASHRAIPTFSFMR